MPSSHLHLAPPWLRLVAAIYDLFPLTALWMLTGALAFLITGGNMDVQHPPGIYSLALFSITGAYFVISWTYGGQTLGMRAWRIKIVNSNNHAISLKQAVLRFAVACISLLVFGLGFLWVLLDSEGRTWHDLAADTRLVRFYSH